VQDITVYRNLGAMLHVKGLWQEAEDNYQQALQLVPEDRVTLINLKRLHQLMAAKGVVRQQQSSPFPSESWSNFYHNQMIINSNNLYTHKHELKISEKKYQKFSSIELSIIYFQTYFISMDYTVSEYSIGIHMLDVIFWTIWLTSINCLSHFISDRFRYFINQ